MKKTLWRKLPAASALLSIALMVCASCATTITPEIDEGYDWTQVKKICVIGVSDLERSRTISKALSHHLFEEGIPIAIRETGSVLDIYDTAREAGADIIVYGSVTKVEVTRSATVYPPTTLKEIELELQFIETTTEKRIWKGLGARANGVNIKDEFIINELVGKMAQQILPQWSEVPRASVGVTMLGIGDEAPPFVVKDIDGAPYALQDQIGKSVIVLEFWSFFCEPCRSALHMLNDIHRSYHLKDISVVAVSLEGEPMLSRIKSRILQDGLDFTFLLDEPEGDSYEIADPYLVPGTPAMYVIDKSGKIVFARAGKVAGDELTAVIESELAKE